MLNETVLFEDLLDNWAHYLIEFVVLHCHPPGFIWVYKGKASELNEDKVKTSTASFRSSRVAVISAFRLET